MRDKLKLSRGDLNFDSISFDYKWFKSPVFSGAFRLLASTCSRKGLYLFIGLLLDETGKTKGYRVYYFGGFMLTLSYCLLLLLYS